VSGIVASAAVANFLVDSGARTTRVWLVRGRRWSLPPPRPTREAPSGRAIAPYVVSCNLGNDTRAAVSIGVHCAACRTAHHTTPTHD
jgi:hypothetical protein